MKWLFAFVVLGLMGLLCATQSPERSGSKPTRSLEDRVREADVVLIGTLYDAHPWAAFAPIKIERMLAGTPRPGTWHLMFLAHGDTLRKEISEAQWVDVEFYELENEDSLEAYLSPNGHTSPDHFVSLEGERRVWILRQHPAHKCYTVQYPEACLPVDSLDTVGRLLKELEAEESVK